MRVGLHACASCGTPTTPDSLDVCGWCQRDVVAYARDLGLPTDSLLTRRFLTRCAIGTVPTHLPDAGPCLIWHGSTDANGYGRWTPTADASTTSAHGWMWRQTRGEVPDGFTIDHLCHDPDLCVPVDGACPHRACVAHLEAVPARVNWARSGSPSAVNARKTRCEPAGHPLWGENLYVHPKRGTRHCRACQLDRLREYSANRAARASLALVRA